MTNDWTMTLPVHVEFGAGCLAKLPAALRGDRRALLITGRRAMRAAGVTDRICSLLSDHEIQTRVVESISSDPNYDEIEAAAEISREFGADVVIGCGGGSALDAAKAVAVASSHPGSILDYLVNGPRPVTAATLPVIAISGTSGTGSHVGRVSVLSDRSRGIKRAIISDYIYPRAAFCDAEILRTVPPEVTAVTGFDAFAQALEGYLSGVEHPMGTLCAQEALRLIHRTLPRVVQRGDDLDLRSQMAWGDTLAGISLATNSIVIPHALSMVLGGRYAITHGLAIATVMVASLEHSRPGAIHKLAHVAKLFGCAEPWGEEALANWAIEAIKRFIIDLGLGISLIDHGVPEKDFAAIADEVRTCFGTRVDADPVPADATELALILQRSIKQWGN